MLVLLFMPYFFKSSAEFAFSKHVLARFTFFPISYHLQGNGLYGQCELSTFNSNLQAT